MRGIDKVEHETFLRRLTTSLVGAVSEADLLRISARTVASARPDAKGVIIIFPAADGAHRGSETEYAEDTDPNIPFSGCACG